MNLNKDIRNIQKWHSRALKQKQGYEYGLLVGAPISVIVTVYTIIVLNPVFVFTSKIGIEFANGLLGFWLKLDPYLQVLLLVFFVLSNRTLRKIIWF